MITKFPILEQEPSSNNPILDHRSREYSRSSDGRSISTFHGLKSIRTECERNGGVESVSYSRLETNRNRLLKYHMLQARMVSFTFAGSLLLLLHAERA